MKMATWSFLAVPNLIKIKSEMIPRISLHGPSVSEVLGVRMSSKNHKRQDGAAPPRPGWWCVFSAAWGLAAAGPQLDRMSGPLTTTEPVRGRRRAAFRGLMELKRTADRQPAKPREPSWASAGSKPWESVETSSETEDKLFSGLILGSSNRNKWELSKC